MPPTPRTLLPLLQRLAGDLLHVARDGSDYLIRTKTTPPQHVRAHRYQVAYAYIVGYLHARGGAEGEIVL